MAIGVQADQLRQIVDAVATAYEKEVICTEQQRQLVRRDAMARKLRKLDEELTQKMR